MIFTATEKRIIDAYINLYSKNSYLKISVQDVCSLAKVSKSTFYYYYENLDAVKDQIETFIYESVSEIFRHWALTNLALVNDALPFPMNLEVLKFVHKHSTTFAALFGDNGDPHFIHRYKEMIHHTCLTKLNLLHPDSSENSYYASILVAIIFATSTKVWKNPDQNVAEEVAILQTKLTNHVLELSV